jgi:hypothetical protein
MPAVALAAGLGLFSAIAVAAGLLWYPRNPRPPAPVQVAARTARPMVFQYPRAGLPTAAPADTPREAPASATTAKPTPPPQASPSPAPRPRPARAATPVRKAVATALPIRERPAPARQARTDRQPAPPASVSLHGPIYEDQLRFALNTGVPEVALETVAGASAQLLHEGRQRAKKPTDWAGLVEELSRGRTDLNGLPLRRGSACQLDAERLKTTKQVSQFLRPQLSRLMARNTATNSFDPLGQEREVLSLVSRHKWAEGSAFALVQMQQPEGSTVRRQLVQQLARTRGERATAELARRALYDLSPDVRSEAVDALKQRPAKEWRQALLDGFRYPWVPVAEHAADALVALQDREAAPGLHRMLPEPDPSAPFRQQAGRWVVRELVRVNHLRNCLLCHPGSFSRNDPVRAAIPKPGEKLQYYERPTGDFVRADVTFLRQDFSVYQPVEGAAPWPRMQRFDYLVRTRELNPAEASRCAAPRNDRGRNYPQREAVLYALERLGGRVAGDATPKD